MSELSDLEGQFKGYYEESSKLTWEFSQCFGEEDSDSESESDSDGGT